MRVVLTAGFLLLFAFFTLPAVHALSPAQMDRAIGGSPGVTQVAANTCSRLYRQCVAKCKKDASCKEGCSIDLNLCNIFGPMY
jgi:hypothetical protein